MRFGLFASFMSEMIGSIVKDDLARFGLQGRLKFGKQFAVFRVQLLGKLSRSSLPDFDVFFGFDIPSLWLLVTLREPPIETCRFHQRLTETVPPRLLRVA